MALKKYIETKVSELAEATDTTDFYIFGSKTINGVVTSVKFLFNNITSLFGVSQEKGQDIILAPSLKLFSDEILRLDSAKEYYNVTQQIPLSSGYYTASTARVVVPTNIRKGGLIITYAIADKQWVSEQYIGVAYTNSEMLKNANWRILPIKYDLEGYKDDVFSPRAFNIDSSLKSAIKQLNATWKSPVNRKSDGTLRKLWISAFGSATDGYSYFRVNCENMDGTQPVQSTTRILTSDIPDLTNVAIQNDSMDYNISAVVDFTAAPYFSLLDFTQAGINSEIIQFSAKENLSLDLQNGYENFKLQGGQLLNGSFGDKNQSLKIPFLFTGKAAISVTVKFDNLHTPENILYHLLNIRCGDNGVSSIQKNIIDFVFTRNQRVTNPNGNNSGDFGDSVPISKTLFQSILYNPTSQTFNIPDYYKRDSIPYTDGNGFSIRYLGDVSISANTDIACELTSGKFRVFHYSSAENIYEVDISTLDGTVRGLFDNLKSNLSSDDYELTMYADGQISSLTQFSYAKLVSLKNNGTVNFYTKFPVYMPYSNEEEITYTFILDADATTLSIASGDNIITYTPLAAFFTQLQSCLNRQVDLYINKLNEVQGVSVTNVTISNNIDEWTGIRRILACGHAIVASETTQENIPMTSSTVMLEKMFQELKKRGFVNVSAKDYIDYLQGNISLPKRTFCVCYDDNRYELFENKTIRNLHLKYDQLPSVAAILDIDSGQYPAGQFPTDDMLRTMESMDWNTLIHGYSHKSLKTMSYEELLTEINNSKDMMDTLHVSSKIWILSGGNTDMGITKELLMNGFLIAPTSSAMPNRSNVCANGHPVIGRMHIEDYVTWEDFITSIE